LFALGGGVVGDMAGFAAASFMRGVPVVAAAARSGQGLPELLQAMSDVAAGKTVCRPHRLANEPPAIKRSLNELVAQLKAAYPALPNARWVAMRLLAGDERLMEALRSGELDNLRGNPPATPGCP
jgi:ferrous iron transport protein B